MIAFTASASPEDGTPTPLADPLAEFLAWRRDVRHFQRKPIAAADMERLFALAQMAPSVGNAQPWRFVRVRTPTLRATLAQHVDETALAAGEAYGHERGKLYSSLKLHGLREAPEIVAVFCDENPAAGHGLGIATMTETLRYSTVLAIHTIWLAAQDHGIGLGWISILDPTFVNTLLAIPEQWHFMALLCIGYPQIPANVPELERMGWQARANWRAHVSER